MLGLIFSIFKTSFSQWKKDNAPLWCAALSYYTIFSLAPLLLIVISTIGLFVDQSIIQKNIFQQLQSFVGKNGALFILQMLKNISKPQTNIVAEIIGIVILLIGAMGVFGQLKAALNHIWRVKAKPKAGIMRLVWDRIINFAMIVILGFLLLVSLILSAFIDFFMSMLHTIIPFTVLVYQLSNFILSFIIISVLFAAIFKILPDIQLPWKYVWPSSFCTAILFTLGKSVIGFYIGHSGINSEYGAAASIIIILLWVFYSTQILFFGAELTKIYALHSGYIFKPSQYAVAEEPIILTGKLVEERSRKKSFTPLFGLVISGIAWYVSQSRRNKKTIK